MRVTGAVIKAHLRRLRSPQDHRPSDSKQIASQLSNAMAYNLLDLPPEILAQILKSLSVRSLLQFSQTSRLSRILANSNLHTLSLAIQPIRSRAAEEYCEQMHCVRIPNANTYDYNVLFKFHNALITSVLTRHADTLQTLDLSLWTLTIPIAKAISSSFGLRNLSIRVEDDLYARAVPRSSMALEKKEQDEAWSLLGQKAVWKRRLRSLKIQNADLTTGQLANLLEDSRWCEDVWLAGCKFIGRDVWVFLGREWAGRTVLQRLHVAECGGPLEEASLEAISGLTGLQSLNIQGCYAMDSGIIEHWNRKVWNIPQLVPPKCLNEQYDSAIEVDPSYM